MKIFEVVSFKEELEVKASSVLGSDGKPAAYGVVDTENPGRPLKTFTGSDAAGKAEEYRDQIRAQRRTQAQKASSDDADKSKTPTKDPSKGLTPKDKASLWQKTKKFLHAGGKAGAGKLGGSLIALLLTSKNLYDEFMNLVDQYVQSGCNRDRYVRHAEQNIRIALVEGVRDLLGGALGGVGAAAAALAFIPGLGWLASVGVGVLGGIAGMVLAKLAANDEVVLTAANWIKDNLVKDMTGLIDVFDESLTEMGYDVKSCRESAQHRPLPDFLKEDIPVYEKVTDQEMKQIGLAMRKEIVTDPKIRRAVKRIKAKQK